MTQEEKYRKALLEAKAVLEPCLKYSRGKVREALDSIDKELKSFESEDERIRKIITDSVFYQYGAGVEYKDVLDYLDKLEKQKYNRMQPIYDNQESFESALDKAWKSYNESGARTVDSCEDDYTECAHAKGFREGFLFGLEKQKEQKPVSISCGHENDAEWGQEDKEKIVTISEIIEHCTTIPYSGGTLTLNKEYKKELLCFIRTLCPSWKPSEEQQSGTSTKSGGNE